MPKKKTPIGRWGLTIKIHPNTSANFQGGVTNQSDVFAGKLTMAKMLLSTWPWVLFLLWPPWTPILWVQGVGVEPPSASNSMSMASSLLQTLAENEFSETNSENHEVRLNKYRPEECRVKNLKQQQKMSMAKLDAHRCLIRDVVVQVPVPDTLIATYVHPSHVVVPRCTGKTNIFYICRC